MRKRFRYFVSYVTVDTEGKFSTSCQVVMTEAMIKTRRHLDHLRYSIGKDKDYRDVVITNIRLM